MDLGSKKANIELGEDWISKLPNEVLISILSLLSTRDSFRTSLLSSRWKNLWKFVPNLSFCPTNAGHQCIPVGHLSVIYMNFIDKIVRQHNSSIRQFHFKCTPRIDQSRFCAWINIVVDRNVQEIIMSDIYYQDIQLPRSLFTCKTLEILKLNWFKMPNVPFAIDFHALKVLHVKLVSPSEGLTEMLFCSSPVLEELEFLVRHDSGKSKYNIASSALKRLSMDVYADQLKEYNSVVIIDAPVLEVLAVYDNCFLDYTLKSAAYIVEASVSVDVFHNRFQDFGALPEVSRLCSLLTAISTVKNLFLHRPTVAALRLAMGNKWPIFPYLTHLRLELRQRWYECHSLTLGFGDISLSNWKIFPNLRHLWLNCQNEFDSLASLLMWAPDLISLVVENPVCGFCPSEGIAVPTCFQSSLKEIEVRKLQGRKSELKLVKYLLESAKVLETLTVEYCNVLNLSEEEVRMEILAMRRCSKNCQVVFL